MEKFAVKKRSFAVKKRSFAGKKKEFCREEKGVSGGSVFFTANFSINSFNISTWCNWFLVPPNQWSPMITSVPKPTRKFWVLVTLYSVNLLAKN